MAPVWVYITGLGFCCFLAHQFLVAGQDVFGSHASHNSPYSPPEVPHSPPEITTSPPITSTHRRPDEIVDENHRIPYCPPKENNFVQPTSNLLVVSTLDGQISALDLNNAGEMFWSVATEPGEMISSTISHMELGPNGKWIKYIPSLSGRLYRFDGDSVQPIPIDADSLLDLKVYDNIVIAGGKESRTYGIDLMTGEIRYECSMGGCEKFVDNTNTMKDILVVQRQSKTIRAMSPQSGDEKWNYSVGLHDLHLHRGMENICDDEDEPENETVGDLTLKAVVPDGIICAMSKEDNSIIKWKRKFQSPIVNAWKIVNKKLIPVNLFGKEHIPEKVPFGSIDDDDGELSPLLYIGQHNNQLYIQESINMERQASEGIENYLLNPTGSEYIYPTVAWKPYLTTSSRTPLLNNRVIHPDIPLLTYDPETARTTALALVEDTEYPYDSGYYLYPEATVNKESNDLSNITVIDVEGMLGGLDPDTVTMITMSLWHWWKEVIFISLVTAFMMNVLIMRPIINIWTANREAAHQKREVAVVYVNVPETPSTTVTYSSSGPFTSLDRQPSDSEFSSRFLSDFEPGPCLGRGGFGVVFQSKNKLDDIQYAVKRITLPTSESSRTKVLREVKQHAKLDHKHIVRYYSTWMETPPVGWQEKEDAENAHLKSWAELGTGPTPFDASTSNRSISETSSHIDPKKLDKNPLKPFVGFDSNPWDSLVHSNQSRVGFAGDSFSCASEKFTKNGSKQEESFDIVFQNSYSKSCAENSTCKFELNCDKSTTSYSSGGELNPAFRNDNESTGGIVFQSDYLSEAKEFTSVSDAVALDMDSSSESEGPFIGFQRGVTVLENVPENNSCCEALDWDENHKDETNEELNGYVTKMSSEHKPKAYLYIVMQLCRKDSLKDWLRHNQVRRQPEVLQMFYQICEGVDYVHQEGLIHRDLKPSNIYFSYEGIIKIGDFGLVTDTQEDNINSSDGKVHNPCSQLTDQVGTQMYMSPEQLAKKPYDKKVDIYSLGLIFFELLVSFSTQSERLHVMTSLKKGKYPDTFEHFDKVQEKRLLKWMLSSRPEKRPDTTYILEDQWIQEVAADDDRAGIKRKRKNTSGSWNSTDIFNELQLDN